MAGEQNEGGVVTTVKSETTQDLDVKAILDARAASAEQPVKEEKAAEEGAAAADDKPKPVVKDGEDDDEPVDFKSLSPAQQKAVAKLYKERRQERRETRELRGRVSQLEATTAGKNAGKPAPAAEEQDPKPKLEDCKNTEDWEEKVYKWRKAREGREHAAREAQAEDARKVESFNNKAAEFAKEHDDYEDVMDSDVEVSPIMFGAILEHGPELGYWFGKNPDEAEKIARMPERQAIKAITRLVIKLEDEAAGAKGGKPAKEAGAAPKKPTPPSPLPGKGPAEVTKRPTSFKDRERALAKDHPGLVNYDT